MKFRKILAGALAAFMAVGSLSISAFAETDASGDYEYQVLSDGTVSITKYLGKGGDVVIPSTIDGMAVSTVRTQAFRDLNSIINVLIPDSITKIENSAFSRCSSLTAINVSDGNKYYTSVGGVVFNKDMTSIIRYPNGKKEANYTIPNGVTKINDYAFNDCTSLAGVVIPDSVTSIGFGAFQGCSSLAEINLPDSVTEIGDWAFVDCASLTEIVIPNSVTKIGETAFFKCALAEINIPASVTQIGNLAFSRCNSLTAINVSDGNKYYISVDGVLFNKDMTSIIHYPAGKKETGYVIPDGVTEIGTYAFEYCSSLTEIIIPDSVTEIAYGAFSRCFSLTEIVIPDGVTEINGAVFEHCSSLTKIIIPDSITSIPDNAFSSSSNLTIYGYTGSYAENYANEENIAFVALENAPETTTATTATEPAATTAPEITTEAPATSTSAPEVATEAPAATTTAAVTDSAEENNVPTGLVITFIPAIAAAAAIIITKKKM